MADSKEAYRRRLDCLYQTAQKFSKNGGYVPKGLLLQVTFLKILYVWVFACTHVCAHMCPWCLWRPEKGVRLPGTRLIDGCELSPHMFLITEPLLQSLKVRDDYIIKIMLTIIMNTKPKVSIHCIAIPSGLTHPLLWGTGKTLKLTGT